MVNTYFFGRFDPARARDLAAATVTRRQFSAAIVSLSWALWLMAGPAIAQDRIPAVRMDVPPRIDGVLEDVWVRAASVTRFQQLEPALRGTPGVRTEVFVGYDEKHLYLAARLWQRRDRVRAGVTRRDGKAIWDGDFVTFVLDSLLSGNSAYFLVVNPSGTVADGILTSAAEWNTDWDGAWQSAVKVSDEYWTVEIALPLSTISFQPSAEQTWGFLAVRRYAEGQERDVSALPDANNPYRIDWFPRLTGLAGLRTRAQLVAQPYLYGTGRSDGISGRRSTQGKFGGDLRIAPNPNLTILATVRPDYAQIESDQEIINVTDVPTSYSEKRPFFTESSDFYQALAINTRNIGDVDAGVKLRHVLRTFRYDVTAVQETTGARWLFADARLTNNRRYLAEVIGGARDRDGRRDYNVTTNLRAWFLDKRLAASTWFGTINGPADGPNELETVNSLRWLSRTLEGGIGSRTKTALYNPGTIGYNALSNEIYLTAWVSPSIIKETGLLRRFTSKFTAERVAVYSGPGPAYTVWKSAVDLELHPADTLGNWSISLGSVPAVQQYFRYRNTGDRVEAPVNRDGFGPFVLVGQRRALFSAVVRSDQGKWLSGRVAFDRGQVRGSRSGGIDGQLQVRLSSAVSAGYTFGWLRIPGSLWQRRSTQSVHRLKIEQSVGKTVDIRAIVQVSGSRVATPRAIDVDTDEPVVNVTMAWRPDARSTLYFVYNQARASEARGGAGRAVTADGRSVAVKLTRSFAF